MIYAHGYFSRLKLPFLPRDSGGRERFAHRLTGCICLQKLRFQIQSPELSTDVTKVMARFGQGASTCRLAAKIAQGLPIVVDKLPPCALQPECQWWQEGQAAYVRCPQGVPENFTPIPAMP